MILAKSRRWLRARRHPCAPLQLLDSLVNIGYTACPEDGEDGTDQAVNPHRFD